jgi:asparagine synthase (glutamine-hydrolysing)
MGAYLSGGKDSRALLGLAARERSPIHSVTFGAPNSRDVIYARRIARRAGSVHHTFEYLDGRWVQEYADLHLDLTEGFHNWVHLHGINTLEPMREFIDLQLTGFCGDHLLYTRSIEGEGYQSIQTRYHATFVTKLYSLFCRRLSWPGLEEGEAEYVFAEPLRAKMQRRAFLSLEQEAARFQQYEPVKALDCFKFVNHLMRLTHNYVMFYRSSMEVRYPFLDYELFDFVSGLRPEIRFGYGDRLYREVLNRGVPELTMIPLDKDERLLTNRRLLRALHASGQRLKSAVNHHVMPIFAKRATLYADYEQYLRTDLKAWGESILFDKRTQDRGIFDPQFLRSLWERHQSGQEVHTIGKIAPMMSYELLLRRLYDPS